ncbi:MAG: IclR family transcriptional regulator, partial [Bilophila wadsworthia]
PNALSASLDIPVATVHRLLMVLRQKNFVACDPATKKYHIGDSCLISPRMDVAAFIRARFLPLAERISRRFGYSTILYARSGYDAVCVERLDGWHPIQVFLNKTGDRRPLGMGSATLSILAAMPEDEAEMILTHNEQEIRFVLKTDFSALRGFLAEARRKGYASAQGMLLEGTIGVSHVLRMGNEAVGSIAIDAVRSEQWDKDQPKIIQELQSALS